MLLFYASCFSCPSVCLLYLILEPLWDSGEHLKLHFSDEILFCIYSVFNVSRGFQILSLFCNVFVGLSRWVSYFSVLFNQDRLGDSYAAVDSYKRTRIEGGKEHS